MISRGDLSPAVLLALSAGAWNCPECDELVPPFDPETGRKRRSDARTCGKERCRRKERRKRKKHEEGQKRRSQPYAVERLASLERTTCQCVSRDRNGLTRSLYLDGDDVLRCHSCGKFASRGSSPVPVEPNPRWLKAHRKAHGARTDGFEPDPKTLQLVKEFHKNLRPVEPRSIEGDGWGRLAADIARLPRRGPETPPQPMRSSPGYVSPPRDPRVSEPWKVSVFDLSAEDEPQTDEAPETDDRPAPKIPDSVQVSAGEL